jgi:hypothetical protein
MNQEKWAEVLRLHNLWLNQKKDGEKADLTRANLTGADLREADLTGADLTGAKYTMPGVGHASGIAYKYVTRDCMSPASGNRIDYSDFSPVYEFPDACTDICIACGAGGNVGTLEWCTKTKRPQDRLLKVSFDPEKDVACVPLASDGKFRLWRFKIVEEVQP